MSFTALNWAWEQTCPSGVAKSVLVYLANCANQAGGDCYPSIPKIALRVQHKEDTIRKALKALVSANLLEIEPRTAENGRQTSHRYRLPVVSIATPPIQGGYVPNEDTWEPEWDTLPKTGGYENCPSQEGDPPDSGGGTPPIQGGNPSLDTKRKEVRDELRSSRVARARRIPEDWQPTDADIRYAMDHNVDPARAAEEFHGYWVNRTGRGSTMVSWSRAFQNRVLQLEDQGRFAIGGSRLRKDDGLSKHERIRREGNLPSFLGAFAPRPDPEPEIAAPVVGRIEA